MRRLILLCLAVLGASCGNSEELHRDDLRVGLSAQQAPRWSLVEEWRVGGAVSGPHSLSNVRAIRVLPDGRIVVLEAGDQQVHILSPRGVPLKTIGRHGGGPGEFSGANYMVIAPNGQIIVYDPTAERLTFLSPNGDLLKTEPHPRGARIAWTTRDGRLEETGTQVIIGPNGRSDTVDFRRTWSADYKKADTVRGTMCPEFKRIPAEFASYRIPYPLGPGTLGLPYPFLAFQRLDTPDGTWVSPFPDFRVLHRVAFSACTPLATITLQGAPIPVPASVHSEMQAALRAQRRPGDALSPDPSRVRAALPLFEALATDTHDRLWVERLVDSTVQFIKSPMMGSLSFYAKGRSRFEVYSPQGALVATVSVPPDVRTPRNGRPFVISGERVYAIILDENDVPYLGSFRIVAHAP